MDKVASLAISDRADLFSTTAAQRGDMSAVIVEKDFWVCWCLRHLFSIDWDVGMIFKGGTSLSKAYGLIRRFSEDVDLSLDRKALGFEGERDPATAESGKKAQGLIKDLAGECHRHVADVLLPTFQKRVQEVLGASTERNLWSLEIDPAEKGTVLFNYPITITGTDSDYIPKKVKLEFGARAEHWPSDTRSITPYCAETIPGPFEQPHCEVKTLSPIRTFWEKATLLHKLHNRLQGKVLADRQSRHYSDLVLLADSEIAAEALANTSLLDAVAQHKLLYFKAGWAKYETAKIGSLKLSPQAHQLDELRRDYQAMGEMFFGEPQDFDKVLARIQELEDQINTMDKPSAG